VFASAPSKTCAQIATQFCNVFELYVGQNTLDIQLHTKAMI